VEQDNPLCWTSIAHRSNGWLIRYMYVNDVDENGNLNHPLNDIFR
jgi:hypothetical protein